MSSFLRQALLRVTGKLVFSRRLPARVGGAKLQVSPSASLAYLRSLERQNWQDLYEFATRYVKPGDVVWDVGANLGVFGFAAAHFAGPSGHVLTIEADPWLAALIRRTTQTPRPAAAPVESLCIAVAERFGLESFEIPAWTRSGSHLSSSQGAGDELVGKSVESHPVVTVSLDWLCQHRAAPQVVKLDLEGSELPALLGGTTLLARHRPKLLLEVYDRSADQVAALLREHRYAMYDIDHGWANLVRVERPAYQTLALPE